MAEVLISEARLPRDFERYAREHSLLELSCEPGQVPGRSRLQSCRAIAPEGFAFSLVLPSAIAALEPTRECQEEWKLARQIERTLRPAWWVVRTPPGVRPTARSRVRLAELFERLREGGAEVAWEAGGLWEPSTAMALATELGAVLVQDVAREDPVPAEVLYARLLALGRGARIGHEVAERVARRALSFERALVVVEGSGAREVRAAVGRLARELEEEWAEEAAEAEELGDEVESPSDVAPGDAGAEPA